MFRALILLLTVAIGLTAGWLLFQDPGYVLFAYQHHSVQMTLWFFVMALLLLVIGIWIIIRSIKLYDFLSTIMPKWRQRRQLKQAAHSLEQGAIAILQGKWQVAEKVLLQWGKQSKLPALQYLMAAFAAQELGALDRRNQYLATAYISSDHAKIAVQFAKIKLCLCNQEYDQAVVLLEKLLTNDPKHIYALKLLYETYLVLERWHDLAAIVVRVKANKLINPEQLAQQEQLIYVNYLTELLTHDQKLFINSYQQLSKALQTTPEIVALQVKYLYQHKQIAAAEKLLLNTIQATWDPTLIELYGKLELTNHHAQLQTAETWVSFNPHAATLYLTLARLATRAKLWRKAQLYYEQQLQLQPTMEAYGELAEILILLGEPEAALASYRQGFGSLAKNV